MLLTLTTTHRPATDLGYLLHKHPGRIHEIEISFGSARVFFPQATEECCTAALLLDIDPLQLARRRADAALEQYVNDRPYVVSSFMSVALGKAFGTALGGRSRERQEVADRPIPLRAEMPTRPARGARRSSPGSSGPSATGWSSSATLSTRPSPSGASRPTTAWRSRPSAGSPTSCATSTSSSRCSTIASTTGSTSARSSRPRLAGVPGSGHRLVGGAHRPWRRRDGGQADLLPRQGRKGLVQPALKCRGREYLRVHEYVFGVLALESEPLDPRL